ncbi:uncharacterized protein F4807DRAFT_466534 [Annulohypoxylon truncatum]|uniref:uncharacterized protein n=1 Tax=Annulohypoxylon truncatum TaxID=327061 RepID=UPI0020084C82|nr:uncharacterized protein F4807DRAFT_466534 [Annulohypoxylon truncatum]KAI1211217.1 hypothetical protein F4807DRAFT_466534 [Annulohypoxylon truncatum]
MHPLYYFIALTIVPLVSGYTVDPPTTAPSDTIKYCTRWVVAVSSDTCSTLASDGTITPDQLYSYNPSLSAATCHIVVGDSYCVEENYGVPPPTTSSTSSVTTTTSTGNGITTPTPNQLGMATNCNNFHKVVSNDTCADISKAAGISVVEFYAWNPAVKTDCSSLFVDYYVCTGIIGGTTVTTPITTSSTTTGNGISTPTPTQTDMVSNCNTFYKVVTGDSCANIASTHGISLDNFYTWNPAVKNDCSLLFVDYYVCVNVIGGTTASPTITTSSTTGNGVSTPTPTQTGMATNCKKFHLVTAGESCQKVADDAAIKLADFYAWNPAVKTDCSLLFVGYYVCIGLI